MYDNIGGKIKGAATAVFILGAIAGVISGFAIIGSDDDLLSIGLIITIGVPLLAYIFSWLLYGFGELIEKTCAIERNMRGESDGSSGNTNSKPQAKGDSEKLKQLEALRSQGLITEEEYRQAIANGK